ncbi:hypothetical protein HZS_911, partial [Henneguya salminicola]
MPTIHLLSFIISTYFILNIIIYTNQGSIKIQLEQDDTLPSVIVGKLERSKNHNESQIKYDTKHNAIYILTYRKSEDGRINDSKLYFSLLTDSSFTEIKLKHEHFDFQFTKIEVGPKIIVGFSETNDLIAISTNFGENWKVTSERLEDMGDILISSQNSRDIAIVDNKQTVYLLKDLGEDLDFQSYYGTHLLWSSNSEFLYFLEKSLETNQINLVKTDNDLFEPSVVLSDVIEYGEIGNKLWAVTKDKTNTYLQFINSDYDVEKAHFPEFLNPSKFYIFGSNSHIYTIVINETNRILFYSASSNDLRFVRIAENIQPSYNALIEPCVVMETFETLPGVIIMNRKTLSTGNRNAFTAISYNFGLKWAHIVPPKIVKNITCILPSCYLKLKLECNKNNNKNSIKFCKKSPSLMISFGSIYRNDFEYYSGIFLSLDVGYSWQLIPSHINSVHILNHGSILLGWSTVLTSFYLKENKCDSNDYEIYTPTLHDKSTCFQEENTTLNAKVIWKNCHKSSPTYARALNMILDGFYSYLIDSTFGHYFINGQCLRDPDVSDNKIMDRCVPGKFVLMSSTKKKFDDNICISNKKWRNSKSDICKFTEQDNSISFLIGSIIKFTSIESYQTQDVINLPIDLTNTGIIKSYRVNFRLSFIYVLNETGIIQFCYNKKELSKKISEEIFLKDYSINGMRLDQTSNDIYYYGLKTIIVINEITKYTKFIHRSHYDITYVNLFPTIGILLYVYNKTDHVTNEHCVNFLSMIGDRKSNLCYDVPILTVAHDAKNMHYVIYFESFWTRVNYNYDFVEKKMAKNQDILEAYIKGDHEYLIKKRGIFFGEKRLYNNHITFGDFHFPHKPEDMTECRWANCDFFCFTTSKISYECGCPNNMVFNNTIYRCVCDAYHPDCTVCEIDELLCDNDLKCVGDSDICDGIKNCKDGQDELNCQKVSKCNSNQYRCLNGDCIPKSKYCDNVQDCPDYSDEKSCQPGCRYFEASCNNGQCILKNQICDDNFDCADLSDEHGCDSIIDATRNLSCFIKCDNKCIPHDKVCNHITDCSDGRDELDCSNLIFLKKEHKPSCVSEDMLKCNSEIICYELYRECDGFLDCPDGIDEANCEKGDLCSKIDIFKCDSIQKCISINDRCDGKYDCLDHSDEGKDCLNKNYIKTIKIKSMQNGNLELIWDTNKRRIKENYHVSFFA